MNEKLKILRFVCSLVGTLALIIYIVLFMGGSRYVFLLARVITATIGLIAFILKCGTEIVSHEKLGNSIFLICICVVDIVLSASQMI